MGKVSKYIDKTYAAWQRDTAKRREIRKQRESKSRSDKISRLKHELEVSELQGKINKNRSKGSSGGGGGSYFGSIGNFGANVNRNLAGSSFGGFGDFGDNAPRRKRKIRQKVKVVYRYIKRR